MTPARRALTVVFVLLCSFTAGRAACEGSGPRYAAPGGPGAAPCLDPAAPCPSIRQALDAACEGETVLVGEGEYTEDVVVERPVTLRAAGSSLRTIVRGTGAHDVVRVLASGVVVSGLTIGDTPGVAALRVGDAAHAGLRDVRLENLTLRAARVGVVVEATGTPGAGAGWIRLAGVVARDHAADGTPHGGVGLLFVGGNGRVQVTGGRLHGNGNAALVIEPAPEGAARNGDVHVAGLEIFDNGADPLGPLGAAIVARAVDGLELEGLDVRGNAPGRASVVLDDVRGGLVACTRVRAAHDGLRLAGGSRDLALVHDHFAGLTGTAITLDDGAAAGALVGESLFEDVARALVNGDATPVAVQRSWFGGAAPPPGAFSGAVVLERTIAAPARPLLVRRPTNSGWAWPVAACREGLQETIDAAPPGALLLVGEGVYRERVRIAKPLAIEGLAGGSGCSPSIVDGGRPDGSRGPTLRVEGTAGVVVSDLVLRNAGAVSACGEADGDEVNLDVDGVLDATFERLCLANGGVTEARVAGASARVRLSGLDIDGAWRDEFGRDLCGHRAREGVLVAGGEAGTRPQSVTVEGARVRHATRGVVVRQADDVAVTNTTIEAAAAPLWAGLAASAVRLETGARGASVTGSTLRGSPGAIRLAGGAEPARDTRIACNEITDNVDGLVVEDFGGSLTLQRNVFARNTGAALRNLGVATVPAAGNWWGAPSGPSGAGGGVGDAVFGATDFGGWLTSSPRQDFDGDGFTSCGGDCDDTLTAAFPGAPESCDGIDGDCNGIVDDAPVPAGAIVLGWQPRTAALVWTPLEGAQGYDLLRGDAGALGASGGAFAASGPSCIARALPSSSFADSGRPAAGAAYWYLVRARNCGGAGSFDAGDAPAAPRDPQLAPLPCP